MNLGEKLEKESEGRERNENPSPRTCLFVCLGYVDVTSLQNEYVKSPAENTYENTPTQEKPNKQAPTYVNTNSNSNNNDQSTTTSSSSESEEDYTQSSGSSSESDSKSL